MLSLNNDYLIFLATENVTDNIPPHIVNLHNAINSSWIDLLDGLQYNIHLKPSLLNLSHPEFCSSVSSLKQPPGANSNFQETVTQFCAALKQYNPTILNLWLQEKEQLIDELVIFFILFSHKYG